MQVLRGAEKWPAGYVLQIKRGISLEADRDLIVRATTSGHEDI